jgi:ABC-type antimicrobial peptide transport system permease subunit
VLVGTPLGHAVAVRVPPTDDVAVWAIVVLGIAGVADVLFLHVRERAPELATLGATGWDDRALGRLVVFEGLWIGVFGAVAGALVGLLATAAFAGALPGELMATSAAAALAVALLSAPAAAAPAAWLGRRPLVAQLAEE